MSVANESELVTVSVPVTFQIRVAVPAGRNARALAEAVAAHAAERFAHVSQAQIHAFNEVNRIHPAKAGEVAEVATDVGSARLAAA
ncbi:hypothetical protein [Azospirillum sp. ST 5-10]|uniref:hypothetical protein n=1 Tax=unclassified Azospirillum TaxID=2630922 RepID=UPI003F49C559